ncbi:hypothetical protein GCM10012284_37400 [Mangrovihabitans endophyticus]|uniref:Uncharacterized protein n=1 Tax=Mangrovihabitans endophyticus TaxID=1751298 RepID=A0A8J3FPZ7_9ACTN|nr:hypothetical protein GCM10012284_37400 [Mangrovihabitans endophyticus]
MVVNGAVFHQEDHTVTGLPNTAHSSHGGPPTNTSEATTIRTLPSTPHRERVAGFVPGGVHSDGCRAYCAARRRTGSGSCSSSIGVNHPADSAESS